MSNDASSQPNEELATENVTWRRSVRPLLALGVGAWLLATLGIVAVSWDESFKIFEILSRLWPLSFLFGGVVLLLVTAGLGLIKKIDAWTAFAVLGAYFVPISVFLLGEYGILEIWENDQTRQAFTDGLVPLAVYIVSLVLATVLGRKQTSDFLLSFAVPSTFVALVAFSLNAFFVFSSDAYIYQDAFGIKVKSVQFENGVLKINGVLQVRKDGNFGFEATYYNLQNPELGINQGTLDWKEGQPSTIGDHPFTLTWRGVNPESLMGGVESSDSSPTLVITKLGKQAVFLKVFQLDTSEARWQSPQG